MTTKRFLQALELPVLIHGFQIKPVAVGIPVYKYNLHQLL